MFEISNQTWEQALDRRPDVMLVGARTTAARSGPGFGLAAVYLRPSRVETGEVAVPIVDHLMQVRLAMAAVLLWALIWRLIRG